MSRLELFRQVLARCEQHVTSEMELAWRPILEQLRYLIAFDSGEPVDKSLIQNIDVSLRAIRNLDDVFPEITKELFQVQRKADEMAIEKK